MEPYVQFMNNFYSLTGVDLESYKRPQMERRLTSLRNKRGFTDFAEFFAAVKADDRLLYEVLDKMTINVSEFLRNYERWQALVPHLKTLAESSEIAAWSAACSTGEEPYSLALMMEEHIKRPYRIVATDIDRRVLHQAEVGEYRSHQVKSVPDSYLTKYFEAADETFRVVPMLKKHVRFQYHDLLADPYPDSLDLIICRNVLIYFTDDAKQRILSGFARALKPGGILFVGSTEQFLHTEQLSLTNIGPFLYRRKG